MQSLITIGSNRDKIMCGMYMSGSRKKLRVIVYLAAHFISAIIISTIIYKAFFLTNY